jgi:tubulin-specific chaperone D
LSACNALDIVASPGPFCSSKCCEMAPAVSTVQSLHGDELLPEAADLRTWASRAASATDSSSEAADCSRICFVLNRYLEQSALLDPALPHVVTTLTTAVIEAGSKLRHRLFTVLYTVAKVRGAKHVVRLLPHEPATFRRLSSLILEAFPPFCTLSVHWETHYFLLLWLSGAVLVPFPLRSIVQESTLDAIHIHSVRALCSTSKISDGASIFLAAFLNRKDTALYLCKFVRSCVTADGTRGSVDGPAAAAALARIFKLGPREELVLFVPALVSVMDEFVDETSTGGMKLKSKLSQRMALLYLKERACTWHYERGSRVLFGASQGAATVEPNPSTGSSFIGTLAGSGGGQLDGWLDPEEEEIVEQVVEVLLRCLRHRDTVVRWSAAKGLGRISGRLPLEYAEDVVDAVLSIFASPAMARADTAWHGGCLALAELARRGLILPASTHFRSLFDVVRRASAFDVRRGAHSVGAHVRDAACYVVWALARAYTRTEVSAHANAIWETMIPTGLLDREVNCRRAASAALQECVGRLSRGVIPEGIELVTLMDYFSLGDRVGAYTQIAPKVALLEGGLYFDCILDELWAGKLMHWDEAVRSLAARALAALVPVDAKEKIGKIVFPKLLEIVVQRGDALHRHGALLGLAELSIALGTSLAAEKVNALREVPQRMFAKGYFKGRVGHLIRIGVCRLIETCVSAKLGIYTSSGTGRAAADNALSILENTLGGTSVVNRATGGEVAEVALSAYVLLCREVISQDAGWSDAVSARVVDGMQSARLVELQRGYVLAGGAIEARLATSALHISLVDCLSAHWDVEVRRNAAMSLGKLLPILEGDVNLKVAGALVAAMDDYAVDERGDVGSWVREAAMSAFTSFMLALFLAPKPPLHSPLDRTCRAGVEGLVTQACERISRTRAVASLCLSQLCSALPDCGSVRSAQDDGLASRAEAGLRVLAPVFKLEVVEKGTNCDASSGRRTVYDGHELLDMTGRLLSMNEMCRPALVGMIASSGGGGRAGSSRWAFDGIFEHAEKLQQLPSNMRLLDFGNTLLSVVTGSTDRLVVPAMETFEYLVRRGIFSRTQSSSSFVLRAVCTVRSSWKGRLRDVSRVAAAVSLIGELASVRFVDSLDCAKFDLFLWKPSMEALVVVLAGPVPRLRRVAAQAIFVAVVEQQAVQASLLDMYPALDLIADTPWESLDMEAARSTRNAICRRLRIECPKPVSRPAPRPAALAK